MSNKNQFLVSLPNITSGSFHKSVVYLQTHNGDGANGWIVNKQLDKSTASKLRLGMKLNINTPIYYGGPVDVTNAYVIHSKDFYMPTTIELNEHISVTRDRAVIDVLNMEQFPEYWRIIVGSSNWGAGQLESEILGSRTKGIGSWINTEFNYKLMWNTMPNEQWNKGIELCAQNMASKVLTCKSG